MTSKTKLGSIYYSCEWRHGRRIPWQKFARDVKDYCARTDIVGRMCRPTMSVVILTIGRRARRFLSLAYHSPLVNFSWRSV